MPLVIPNVSIFILIEVIIIMDIQREKKPTPLWRKYWYVPVVIVLVVSTYKLKSFMGDASFIVKQSELVTAVVEQGRFQVNVRATGVLKPMNIRWVSSQVAGKVEQAFVKAGAKVEEGQVLM